MKSNPYDIGLKQTLAVGLAVCLAQLLAPAAGFSAGSPGSRVTPTPPRTEVATLAGGCFWSMEAIFKQLRGVKQVVPGYSGGTVANPSYEQVETGATGHAESLQITFDPKVISYRELLQVFFTVRDPTTINRQGNDIGPQYRSVIFYRNEDQRQVARQAMQAINAAHLWQRPIVTQLVPYARFYRAENYHFDYYRLHPDEPYCRYVIAPEIAEFRARFRERLK